MSNLHFTAGRNTVLHIAALQGNLDLAVEALKKKPELLQIKNAQGDTPLHLAARAGQVNVVERLVYVASSPPLPPHQSDPPPHPHQSDPPPPLPQVDPPPPSSLHELVHAMNNFGNTALHEAVQHDCSPVVDVLLSAVPTASALLTHPKGESALYIAAARGSTDIVSQLLRIEEASCEGPNGQTALHAAVSTASYKMVRSLVKQRPTLLTRADEEGITPLHLAALYGDCTMVQVLLESNVSAVYLPDKNGLSPIHVAAMYKHLSVVQYLIDKCPDCVELVDKQGWNFFHLAIREGVVSIVDHVLATATLIKQVNVPDKEGNTPMHLAVLFGRMMVVKKLSSRTEFVTSSVNHQGDTAFDVVFSQSIPMPERSQVERQMMMLMRYTSFESIDPLRFRPLRLKQILDCLTSPADMIEESVKARHKKSELQHTSVVAALIATATFAAAFALPGGYQSDQGEDPGTAWLSKRAAFDAFLVFDSIAMVISMFLIVYVREPLPANHWISVISLLRGAITAFMAAFACGVYVAIADRRSTLAAFICGMVLTPFLIGKLGPATLCRYNVAWNVIRTGLWGISITECMPPSGEGEPENPNQMI